MLATALPAAALVDAQAFAPPPEGAPATDAHRDVRSPITIELALEAEPEVHRPVELRAALVAEWADLSATTIRVRAPDEVKVTGLSEVTGDLRRDEPYMATFGLKAIEPGTYLIAVEASASHEVGTLGGYAQAYLEVPGEGPGAFHRDHLPVSEYSLPAVRIEVPPLPLAPPADGQGDSPLPAELPLTLAPEEAQLRPLPPDLIPQEGGGDDSGLDSHSTFVVSTCFVYKDEPGNYQWQRFVWVQIWDSDADGDDFLTDGLTDGAGCFTSGSISRAEECCSKGNQDVYIRFVTCTGAVCVTDTSGNQYDAFTSITTVGSEDTLNVGTWGPPGTEEWAWRPYQYGHNGWDFAVNRMLTGGVTGVTIQIPDSCTYFTPGDDTIHLCANGVDDKSPDDVLHEYGHFVMDKMYNDAFDPSPGGAHFLCQDNQNRGLAWSEGFANYFGPRANNEIYPTSGANGDADYSRPWNGSQFVINMENRYCSTSIVGDDDEINVAQALWDLRDSNNDGTDISSNSNSFISDVMEACNDSHYRDYFDGSGGNSPTCNWTTQGGSTCNFLRTAFNNFIDWNAAPSGTVTSQTTFAWVKGTLTISGTASDTDASCPLGINFFVSSNNVCSTGDYFAGTDTSSPYSVAFNTATIPDDASYWTCAQPNDGMENGAFAISAAAIGVDNTAPGLTVTPSGTMGNAGWWRSSVTMTVSCSDPMSGVATGGITYQVNGGASTPYTGPFSVSGQGANTVTVRCRDNAQNEGVNTQTVNIDSSVPTASVNSPAVALVSYTVSWTFSDVPSGLSGLAEIQERNSVISGPWTTVCTQSVSGFSQNGSCVRSPLVSGQYCYRAVVSDVAGNTQTTLGTTCTLKV